MTEGPWRNRCAARGLDAGLQLAAHAGGGGDWHDVVTVGPRRDPVIVVGDVMGHGAQAARESRNLRTALRDCLPFATGPADLLERLDSLVQGLDLAPLVSVAAVRIRLQPDGSATLLLANAGHPPPLLLTPDGTNHFLDGGVSPMLGAPWREERAVIPALAPAGSTLLLYSDGLVERRGEDLDTGLARLRAHSTLARFEGSRLLTGVEEAIRMLASKEDDCSLVAVRWP